MTAHSAIIDLTGIVRHQTDRAVLIDTGGKATAWLPLALVDIAPNGDGRTVTVTLPEWLALEKGLI